MVRTLPFHGKNTGSNPVKNNVMFFFRNDESKFFLKKLGVIVVILFFLIGIVYIQYLKIVELVEAVKLLKESIQNLQSNLALCDSKIQKLENKLNFVSMEDVRIRAQVRPGVELLGILTFFMFYFL